MEEETLNERVQINKPQLSEDAPITVFIVCPLQLVTVTRFCMKQSSQSCIKYFPLEVNLDSTQEDRWHLSIIY